MFVIYTNQFHPPLSFLHQPFSHIDFLEIFSHFHQLLTFEHLDVLPIIQSNFPLYHRLAWLHQTQRVSSHCCRVVQHTLQQRKPNDFQILACFFSVVPALISAMNGTVHIRACVTFGIYALATTNDVLRVLFSLLRYTFARKICVCARARGVEMCWN